MITEELLNAKIRERRELEIMDLADEVAKLTARTRRILELEGRADWFDGLLDESCKSWFEHYREMGRDEITLEIFMEG